jgi:hypothetical protein
MDLSVEHAAMRTLHDQEIVISFVWVNKLVTKALAEMAETRF